MFIVDREPSRRVDDQHVHVVRAGVLHCAPGDVDRFFVAGGRHELRARLTGHRFQLLDGRRAIDVGRHHRHFLALLLQHQRELAAGGGLAGALQSRHQDDGRRLRREVERGVRLAHQRGELAVHHANQRLPRREAADDLGAERLGAHGVDEVLDHRQRDVRLQQRDAHFAQRFLDVRLRQARFAAKLLDDAREAGRQGI
jgi:hypothetical protein